MERTGVAGPPGGGRQPVPATRPGRGRANGGGHGAEQWSWSRLATLLVALALAGSLMPHGSSAGDVRVEDGSPATGPAAGQIQPRWWQPAEGATVRRLATPTPASGGALEPRGPLPLPLPGGSGARPPGPLPPGAPAGTGSGTRALELNSWLVYLNVFRLLADLPLLSENLTPSSSSNPDDNFNNQTWSEGSFAHSRYMVKNNIVTHDEDPTNPFYTPEGYAAGKNSNVAAYTAANATDEQLLNQWLTGPFHLVGIIDPRLTQTGYGAYREGNVTAATLNVISDLKLTKPRPAVAYPVRYPGEGKVYPLASYNGGELPDPLAPCPGYVAPTGAPIVLQLPTTPSVTAFSLTRNGQGIEACLYDETSYRNPDANGQADGRAVLAARHAIVMMPREPLTAATYRVSITSGGQTYAWSFYGPGGPGGVPVATPAPTPTIVGTTATGRVFSGGTYDPVTSTFYLRSSPSTGPADIVVTFGPVGPRAVPLLGDWDGNGTYTVGLYDPDLSRFYLRNSNTTGGADVIFDFGASNLGRTAYLPIPVVGDWTGAGYSQVGLYEPWLSRFLLRVGANANGAPPASVLYVDFGQGAQVGPGYVEVLPIVGNWAGSLGTTTKVGLYVPSQSRFLLKLTAPANGQAGQADRVVTFGNANGGYQPVVGDWDGDGKTSLGLYLPSTDTFFLTNSTASGTVDRADLQFQLTGPPAALGPNVRALTGAFR